MCINLYYYRSISHFPFYQKPQSPLLLTASQGSRARVRVWVPSFPLPFLVTEAFIFNAAADTEASAGGSSHSFCLLFYS